MSGITGPHGSEVLQSVLSPASVGVPTFDVGTENRFVGIQGRVVASSSLQNHGVGHRERSLPSVLSTVHTVIEALDLLLYERLSATVYLLGSAHQPGIQVDGGPVSILCNDGRTGFGRLPETQELHHRLGQFSYRSDRHIAIGRCKDIPTDSTNVPTRER